MGLALGLLIKSRWDHAFLCSPCLHYLCSNFLFAGIHPSINLDVCLTHYFEQYGAIG